LASIDCLFTWILVIFPDSLFVKKLWIFYPEHFKYTL
jgi:hypothetical protein